jgi:hypothetical protein
MENLSDFEDFNFDYMNNIPAWRANVQESPDIQSNIAIEAMDFNENEDENSTRVQVPTPTFTGPFHTMDEAFEFAQTFAAGNFYVVVKRRTRKNEQKELKSCDVYCDLGRAAEDNRNTNRSRSSSKRINCPFNWFISRKGADKKWFINIKKNHHNHRIDRADYNGHAVVHRLLPEHIAVIEEQDHVYSTSPSHIMAILKRRFPDYPFYINSIYNARKNLRKRELAGRTPFQALVDRVHSSNNYRFDTRVNAEGQVKNFFFAHYKSIELFNKFSTVLIMDSTYKTNKLKMPLLQVTGTTNMNTTFILCGVFMTHETEDDYLWALNTIKDKCFTLKTPSVITTDRERALINAIVQVVPSASHLLCRWHIGQNILSKLSTVVSNQDQRNERLDEWKKVVANNHTEEDFWAHFFTWADQFNGGRNSVFIKYVLDTWIDPYKERYS